MSSCTAGVENPSSMITLCDGAALAHLGNPDMRVPISYALHYSPTASTSRSARWTSPRSGSLTF